MKSLFSTENGHGHACLEIRKNIVILHFLGTFIYTMKYRWNNFALFCERKKPNNIMANRTSYDELFLHILRLYNSEITIYHAQAALSNAVWEIALVYGSCSILCHLIVLELSTT